MGDDDLVVILVGLRLPQKAREGGKAGAGGEKPDALAGDQRVMHQRAHGLGAQDDLVARLDMLKLGGQRPVGTLME
jgi:hypothetical protein